MDDAQLQHLHAALQNDNTYLGSPANCAPGRGRWEDDGQKGQNFSEPKPPTVEHPVPIVMSIVGKVSNVNICMGPLGAHRAKKADFKLLKTRKTIVLNCPAKTPFSTDWATAEAKLNHTVALQTTEKPAYLWLEKSTPEESGSLKIGCPAFVIRDSTMPVDNRIMAAVPKNEKDDDEWKEIVSNYTLAFVPVYDHQGYPIPQNDVQFSLLNATVLAKFTLRMYKWAGRRVNVTADITSLSILYTSRAIPRTVGVPPVDYTCLPRTPGRNPVTRPSFTPPQAMHSGLPYYQQQSPRGCTPPMRTPPSANAGRKNPYPTPLGSPFGFEPPPAVATIYSTPQPANSAIALHNGVSSPLSHTATPLMRTFYPELRASSGTSGGGVTNHPYHYWPNSENGPQPHHDIGSMMTIQRQHSPPTPNMEWPNYGQNHSPLRPVDIYQTPHIVPSLGSVAHGLPGGEGGTSHRRPASAIPAHPSLPVGVNRRSATAPIPDVLGAPTKDNAELHAYNQSLIGQSRNENVPVPSNHESRVSIQNKEPQFTFDQASPVVHLESQNRLKRTPPSYESSVQYPLPNVIATQAAGVGVPAFQGAGLPLTFDVDHNIFNKYITQSNLLNDENHSHHSEAAHPPHPEQSLFEQNLSPLVGFNAGHERSVTGGQMHKNFNDELPYDASEMGAGCGDVEYQPSAIGPAHAVFSPAPLPIQDTGMVAPIALETVATAATVGALKRSASQELVGNIAKIGKVV
ncbi:hypothetical protein C8J55DRAFT_554486 [Lentinula edodes]|uniref:Uncharacterized protein n=1 Tax=Lentinula lateritia TaxID=40482 RepID=A0A9W9E0B3_9AGAR|nr:hypothetical protein C8J55DRAFT_554486 [Lentinula edodes]